MPTEHFIIGKDASLEQSISTMQGRLKKLGFHVEEKSWLNPIEGIWSVHIRDRDCPLMFTNGKGATKLAARASALGEYFERLSCNYFWNHYYLGYEYAEGEAGRDFVHYPQEKWFPAPKNGKWPKGLLNPELHQFYNPNSNIHARNLIDFNTGNRDRGICAIPYTRVRGEELAYIPVNIIANLYVSNGMSAGNTAPEARTQALSEIFERYIKFKIISEGICLPEVPDRIIAKYPRIAAGIAGLRAAGFGILVKDASLGGKFPVMNVTLLHPKDQGCFSSFGAHPRFEIALERALTELLQGRALDTLEGFPEPGFDMEEIASSPNIEIHFVDSSGVISWNFMSNKPDYKFVHWNFSKTTAQDYEWSVKTIHDMGFDIYVADFTHLDVYACRIIVPGMSEIYPVDELEFENNAVANDVREPIFHLADLDKDECSDLLDTLNESGVDDQRLVAGFVGLVAGGDPFWTDLRIGELKTLLALACKNIDAISEGCEWIRHFGQLNAHRKLVYRCIDVLHQLKDDKPYKASMATMFSRDVIATAKAHLSGKQKFFGQPSLGMNLSNNKMHQELIKAYGKLHSKKKSHS